MKQVEEGLCRAWQGVTQHRWPLSVPAHTGTTCAHNQGTGKQYSNQNRPCMYWEEEQGVLLVIENNILREASEHMIPRAKRKIPADWSSLQKKDARYTHLFLMNKYN